MQVVEVFDLMEFESLVVMFDLFPHSILSRVTGWLALAKTDEAILAIPLVNPYTLFRFVIIIR